MRLIRRLLIWAFRLVAVVLALVAVVLIALTALEYRPADVESVAFTEGARRAQVEKGQKLTLATFNIGYAALGRDADFFMDGGASVRPDRQRVVQDNLSGIAGALVNLDADILLLQEVDVNATRSYSVNEAERLERETGMGAAFALNYKCVWVPYPWPMIGAVEGGLLTLNDRMVTSAERVALPTPFSWPLRIANLKRCLLVQRMPVAGTDKELVLINLHLDAYDEGEGRLQQARVMLELMREEYQKGNYVIAGGDFNCTFPNAQPYPILDAELWKPSVLREDDLPPGFRFVNDSSRPTCRLLDRPYTGDRARTQLYVIDGFILSDNIQTNNVETIDLNFLNSDHNPVRLTVTLR